jgi:hypothetical protein
MPHTIENPRPLETEFDIGNYHYQLEKRAGNVVMFKVTRRDTGKEAQWEVALIHVQKGGVMFGKTIEPYERYPSNNDFGRIAWGYQLRPDAEKKYAELAKPANNPS